MRVVTLSLLVCLLAFSVPTPVHSRGLPYDSVKQLQDQHEDGVLHSFCTTWATRLGPQKIVVWVTAAHCLVLGPDGAYLIDGKPATLAAANTDLDLAFFTGGPNAPGLPLAYGKTPNARTQVYTIGFPLQDAYKGALVFQGIVSSPDLMSFWGEDGWWRGSVYDFGSAPGASGAPVMINGNLVVGMVVGGPGPFTSMSIGVRLQDLRLFLYGE